MRDVQLLQELLVHLLQRLVILDIPRNRLIISLALAIELPARQERLGARALVLGLPLGLEPAGETAIEGCVALGENE